MSYKIFRYGWLPDLPGHGDFLCSAPVEITSVLPAKCYSDVLKYKAVLHQCLTPILSQLKGCVAYGYLIVRNSWGSKWGMKGYFALPYPYLISANLGSDFWTIRVVA